MEEQPLMVFTIGEKPPTLRTLLVALQREGYPIGFGTGIAGEAELEELEDRDWDSIFVRWNEPELHEVALLVKSICKEEHEAESLRQNVIRRIQNSDDEAGKLIVTDHLRRTQDIYALELLPAILENDDHPAWEALDILLRVLAEQTEGLIFAEGEGFCGADGEMILEESDGE